jgi:hypothetical protein
VHKHQDNSRAVDVVVLVVLPPVPVLPNSHPHSHPCSHRVLVCLVLVLVALTGLNIVLFGGRRVMVVGGKMMLVVVW